MSGIIGSRFNIRGSGLVGSLGTDGQVFTSSGAGTGAVFEAAAGGGRLLQSVLTTCNTDQAISSTSYADLTGMTVSFTPTDATSKLLITAYMNVGLTVSGTGDESFFSQILRDSTVINNADTGVGYGSFYYYNPGSSNLHAWDMNVCEDDGHDTTSAVTIKCQGKTGSGDSIQFNLNSSKKSYLLVQEISTS